MGRGPTRRTLLCRRRHRRRTVGRVPDEDDRGAAGGYLCEEDRPDRPVPSRLPSCPPLPVQGLPCGSAAARVLVWGRALLVLDLLAGRSTRRSSRPAAAAAGRSATVSLDLGLDLGLDLDLGAAAPSAAAAPDSASSAPPTG